MPGDSLTVNAAELEKRLQEGRQVVNRMMSAERYRFHDIVPSKLPETPGVYLITTQAGEILRVGRTDKLRQRLYANHLMGDQKGNLPAQLCKDRVCGNLKDAKEWIRQNCLAQFLQKAELDALAIEMKWAEHFLLATLRPRFTD